jgi:hypothetical protein
MGWFLQKNSYFFHPIIQDRPRIRHYKSDTTEEASLNKVITNNEQWKSREIYAAL